MRIVLAGLVGLALAGSAARAQTDTPAAPSDRWIDRYFRMVEATQAGQPHWISPLVTTTPRLNERFRFDVSGQSRPSDVEQTNFGSGKGVELIVADRVAVTFGIPGYLVRETPRGTQSGWTDEAFLVKCRFASANEEHGNYVVSGFFGVSVPTGSDFATAGTPVYTPTLAFGKGWGTRKAGFDVQSTVAVSIPGGDQGRIGVPVVWNTALQGHVGSEFLWPEFEVNLTHWTDGPSDGKWQAVGTAGLVLGRFPLAGRLHVDVGAGYQFAMSAYRTYDHAWVATFRMPF